MSAPSRWSRMAERGSILGIRFTVACYRLFGRPLSLLLVHVVVAYFFLTDRRGRAASRAYLRRVAATAEGARALGRPVSTWLCFLHYRAFALSIFDRMVLWLGREGAFGFDVQGREHFDRLVRPDRGALVVGAHLGSFDALRALADHDGRVVNVLMFTRHAPRINAVFRELSPRAELRVIEAAPDALDTVLQIRACIARGELVAMLGDRVEPGDRHRTCEVALLGAPVRLPVAPYLLAGLLACPLLYMVALRTEGGHYRVIAEPLAERVALPRADRDKVLAEYAAAYASRLEQHCLEAPLQWFNFFDYWGDAAS